MLLVLCIVLLFSTSDSRDQLLFMETETCNSFNVLGFKTDTASTVIFAHFLCQDPILAFLQDNGHLLLSVTSLYWCILCLQMSCSSVLIGEPTAKSTSYQLVE